MAIIQSKVEGESRLLFTGFGEPEFRLFVSQVNRLVPFYDFVKSAVQNIDMAKIGTLEQQKHMMESIKYLKLKIKPCELYRKTSCSTSGL